MRSAKNVVLAVVFAAPAAVTLGMGCGSSGAANSASQGTASGLSAGSMVGSSGGLTGTGGASTTTGGPSTTGSSSGAGGQAGGCSTYPGQDPSSLPGAGCCSFGPSHCAPTSSIPPALDSAFAACTGGLCVPDPIIQKGSEYVPTLCTANVVGLMLTGVCLSQCITLVSSNPQVSLLSQGACGAGELCVPCTDPLNNTPTGACSITDLVCPMDGGTDASTDASSDAPSGPTCPYTGPPIIDPSTFPACAPTCMGAHCVPAAIVPAAEASQLASCMSMGGAGYCAPDTLIASAGAGLPPTCVSIAGAEGRCLSTCLPAVAAEASLLPQATCASDERCVPCFNPTAADPTAPTGACTLACDMPAEPPTMLTCPWNGPPVLDPSTLPGCDNGGCGGAHCLPAAEVPASVQSQLAPCAGNTGFCAPDAIISTGDNFIPTSCDPFPGSGAPGRCLSNCLPSVQAEASTLAQSSCPSGDLCVPCNDPFTGASTGACTLSCDTPPATPFTFPKCCNDGTGTLTGTCVPTAQVPASEQSELSQSGNGNSSPCPASGASYICVPDEYLPAPYNSIPLQACSATIFGFCGTCVSQCIVNSELPFLTSSTCAADHKCVECTLAPSTPGCATFCP